MMTTRTALFCVALASIAQHAPAADGSDMFRNARDLKKGEGGPTMSMATLRTCVALEYEIRDLRRDSDSAGLSLEVAQGSLRGADQWVAAAKSTLDLHDARSVDDYNRKLEERQKLLDAYNTKVEPYNAMLDRLDTATAQFNHDCTAPYLEADRLKVLGEREDAIRKRMDAEKADGGSH